MFIIMFLDISDNNTNTEFFKNNFDKKYIRDYFFIYILLLYQSYSSSHYSRLLTKFPADVQMIETDAKYLEQLESLARQISLFLVKSFYESVSNVQHQNGVYLCVKKALRIEENMKSITVGLEALCGIEVERQRKDDEEKESKRERAINTGLTLFGFLVVISTMIDALNLVDWFKGNSMGGWHIASVSIILFVTVVVLIVLLVNSIKKK